MTSSAVVTSVARSRGTITTTTGRTATTGQGGQTFDAPAGTAGFPMQHFDNFYYGNNKIYTVHIFYDVQIIAGSGMASNRFYPFSPYPPSQQEAADLLSLYHSLEEWGKKIKVSMASGNSSGSNSSSSMSSALELSREQELTVNMILLSTTGWTVAPRKILAIVFGTNTLAESCAVGRKNSTTTALSSLKLRCI